MKFLYFCISESKKVPFLKNLKSFLSGTITEKSDEQVLRKLQKRWFRAHKWSIYPILGIYLITAVFLQVQFQKNLRNIYREKFKKVDLGPQNAFFHLILGTIRIFLKNPKTATFNLFLMPVVSYNLRKNERADLEKYEKCWFSAWKLPIYLFKEFSLGK